MIERNLTKEAKKENLSIYLDVNLVNDIEDFIYLTKKRLPIHKKKKFKRTTLIQLVLREVMDEHMRSADKSFLYELISTWAEQN